MTPKQFLQLVKSRRYDEEGFAGPTITVVSARAYNANDESPLQAFLDDLALRIEAKVGIIGGGYGCTITRIAIYTEDPKKAMQLMDHIKCYGAKNEHTTALSIEVILLPDEGLAFYPRDGRIQQCTVNQNTVNQNITVAGSINDSSFSGRDLSIKNADSTVIIGQIEEAINSDPTLSTAEKQEYLNTAGAVKSELSSTEPKKEVVKPLLDTLSKVASIASLVINFQRVIGYIP